MSRGFDGEDGLVGVSFQVFDVLLDADSQSEVPRLWKPVKGCHKGAGFGNL